MSKTNNKTKKIVLAVLILAVLIAAAGICYKVFAPKATQGAKAITIEVTDDQGKTTNYDVHTDAEYLRQAMDETKDLTYDGTESKEYGMMIDTINGVKADYTADQAYWCILVNGEYGQFGIDSQPVADGDTYTFVYTQD